jgi:hypothetical protein
MMIIFQKMFRRVSLEFFKLIFEVIMIRLIYLFYVIKTITIDILLIVMIEIILIKY